MATTAELTSQLAAAKQKYSNLLTDYNNKVITSDQWARQTQECAAKRDACKFPCIKNNKCHIDTLSNLNNQWAAAANARDVAKAALDAQNTVIKNLESQIASQQQTDVANYQSSPTGIQQNAANQLAAQKAELEAKNQRTLIIAGVAVFVIIAGIFVYVKWFRR